MIRVRLILHSPALEAGVRALLDGDAEISVLGGLASNHGSEKGEAADVQIMTSAAFAHRMASAPVSGSEAALIILDPSSQDMQRLWSSSMPWGALPMEVSSEELRAAVHATASGLVVALRPLLALADEPSAAHGPLTERQVEILGMLLQGLANKQIAAQLGISEHTVKFHVSSIYTKLNVANRTEAVREGLRNGWITL